MGFRLIKPETNFYADLHIHWPSIFHRGLEAPLSDGLYSLGIEPHAETAHYSYVARMSLIINDKPEDARSLRLGQTSLLGIFGIRCVHRLWRGYSAANFEHSAANSAPTASAHSCAVTYANSTPRA